jgi:hypothetical protein
VFQVASTYAPATTSFLTRLSVLSLLGYFSFLLLVLFTYGNIPEVIKRGAMRGRNITPSFVFLTCLAGICGLALVLAPLEHFTAGGALAPLFGAMGAFKLPTLNGEALALALGAAAAVHGCSFALYASLPARQVEGYVLNERGEVAVYRLPGFALLVVGAGAWALGARRCALPATWLWDHSGDVALASCLLGLGLSAAFYFRGSRLRGWGNEGLDMRARCPSRDMRHLLGKRPLPKADKSETQEFRLRDHLDHFYCGLSEFNPVTLGVDWKMWLYATGAVLLQQPVAVNLDLDRVDIVFHQPVHPADEVGNLADEVGPSREPVEGDPLLLVLMVRVGMRSLASE